MRQGGSSSSSSSGSPVNSVRPCAAAVVGLLVYIAVIVGVGLVLRSVGVDHTVAWVLGIVAGGIVMAAFQISGFYSRSWREDSGTSDPGDTTRV
jgi:hypothetical protein